MADIFAVIADPTRRELLRVLRGEPLAADPLRELSLRGDPKDPAFRALPGAAGQPGPATELGPAVEHSVGELVVALGLSQPTVSKHLRVLRLAGLVHVREDGQHRYYSLDSRPLERVDAWLAPFLPEVDFAAVVPLRSGVVGVPAPLRRAAQNLPDVGDVGATLGRAVAGARSRILDPAKKRLGHRE